MIFDQLGFFGRFGFVLDRLLALRAVRWLFIYAAWLNVVAWWIVRRRPGGK